MYLLATLVGSAILAYSPEDSRARGLIAPPPCSMRVRLGIPCPLCYGTTTYILIWRGRFGAALRLSPFVFALFFASAAALPFLLWLALSGRALRGVQRRIAGRGWLLAGAVAGALLLLNWVYLILTFKGVSPEAFLRAL